MNLSLAEDESSTTRQAKSKALETLSTSANKRRHEIDSDPNEEHRSSLSPLSRRVSTSVRRRRRTNPYTHSKTSKRPRQSSSEEEEDDEDELLFSKSKRHSASPLPHRHQHRRKKSDSDPQTEGTDTGNLCVRRRTGNKDSNKKKKRTYSFALNSPIGGRDLNTVVSDPATSTANRRSRRYTTKSYIDYLSTGQPSTR